VALLVPGCWKGGSLDCWEKLGALLIPGCWKGATWAVGRSWGRCSYRAVGRGQPGLLGEAGGAAHTGLLEGGMLLAPIKKAA
jgi:hypothetical protein